MMLTPTLGTACPSLPPEGANPALGRPGGGGYLAPTLAAARAALPPRGANPPWGGPAVDCVATTLAATWWGGGMRHV
jgi:hypothetical protein